MPAASSDPSSTALAVRSHPLYAELIEALTGCTERQRRFLTEFPKHDYIVARTTRAIEQADGRSFSSQSVYGWMRDEAFSKARALLEQLAAEVVGVSQASTLARINSLVEDAIANGDPVYHDGARVGSKPARGDALRGLETLAKATRLVTTEAPSVRVTLNLVDLSGQPEAIDVTPARAVLDAALEPNYADLL
jgi:hypothetical protein